MFVTVDPTSCGITRTERGGSVAVYSGNITWSPEVKATSIRRAYSDIPSKILTVNTI